MTLTIELPEEQQAVLAAKAREKGVSAEEYVRQVLTLDLEASVRPRRHISEIIRENMSRVPAEIMATLPKDGASEHDHYIYGLPKRNPYGSLAGTHNLTSTSNKARRPEKHEIRRYQQQRME